MARFMTYLALLALAAVAVTSPVSAIPDPNAVAQAANAEVSTTPEESVDNAATTGTVTGTAATLADSANTNTAAAISDSISNVTTETSISASASASSAGSNTNVSNVTTETSISAWLRHRLQVATRTSTVARNLLRPLLLRQVRHQPPRR
ncbi:hypothetical protein P3T76_003936 [Phytophthora citrophthora]|uniref:RxLR effector protein n=1 Tax=Phytophthora citrophthora TaxID=4793 RepID=A0AAD9GS51_9STRA|nr:hypothetical protein P3T76_003936 [Phytophthora citrophthora]